MSAASENRVPGGMRRLPPMRLGPWLAGWAGATALLMLLKGPTLRDPHFWDAAGCYVPQARFLLTLRLPLSSMAAPPFIRPPLFTGLLALVMRLGGTSAWALHVTTLVFTALALPATYFLTRSLGGGRRAGGVAVLLLLCTPLYFSQVVQAVTDLPAATLLALSWVGLLRAGVGWYMLFAGLAVLTKESSYFICLPAAALLCLRRWRERPGRWWALLAAWPAAVPGVVLLGWLCLHAVLTGHAMAPEHVSVFSKGALLGAPLHNFVERGRLFLILAALRVVVPTLRDPPRAGAETAGLDRDGVLSTALLVALLPLCFPAGLPRYMSLSLPPLAALAALGLGTLEARYRVGSTAALAALLISAWHGDSWHENTGFHLEDSLEYRTLLAMQKEAAELVRSARPRRVLAGFPMTAALRSPPEDGYLPAPLTVDTPTGSEPLSELCAHQILVGSDGEPIRPTIDRLREAGALSLWREVPPPARFGRGLLTPGWARRNHTIRIYRIDCGPATTAVAPAP